MHGPSPERGQARRGGRVAPTRVSVEAARACDALETHGFVAAEDGLESYPVRVPRAGRTLESVPTTPETF